MVVCPFLQPQLPCALQQGSRQKDVSVLFPDLSNYRLTSTVHRNNGSRFPLDAMIAYVLHENTLPVKPYPALDEAVVRLLISGDVPEEFSRQDVQMWEQSTDTGSLVSPAWRPFSAEAVTREALANLEKWATNPDNRLLTF